MGEHLPSFALNMTYFLHDTKNVVHERKINELDFMKMKTFCSEKDPVKKVKGQGPDGDTHWHITWCHRRLVVRKYKHSPHSITRPANQKTGKKESRTDTPLERTNKWPRGL